MNRHVTKHLHELLELFPCVAIIGVRQCGKTTLLQRLEKPWQIYDLEKAGDLEIISHDPDLFFRLNPEAIAIDEAQTLPQIFPALRVAIDADRNKTGRFIITGSSSPELLNSISESLAGRVAIVELGPLTFSEALNQSPSPLYELIDSRKPLSDFQNLSSHTTVQQIHDYWFAGGYPEPWLKNKKRFTDLWMENYIKTYLERDILQLFPNLNRVKYKQFLQMLSNLSGMIINYSQVARTLSISQPTAREYFNIGHGTFVWRHIPAFEKNAAKRIIKHPKGYLRDTGLLHHLLHLKSLKDLMSHPGMGYSWESMIIENLLRNFNSTGIACNYYHYRTGGGAEVDLILEGDFGLVPVEIKHGQNISMRELRGIRDFIQTYKCDYGLVIYNGENPRLLDVNLMAIPATCI